MNNLIEKDMFLNMLSLQDELNSKIDKNWRNLRREWYRAAWAEANEIFERLPWEWWKSVGTSPDIEEIHLELIDILHFVLSDLINKNNKDNEYLAQSLSNIYKSSKNDQKCNFFDLNKVTESVEHYIQSCISFKTTSPYNFFVLCHIFKIDLPFIYSLYIGKQCLNMLRQNNGYKEKKYIKLWPSNFEHLNGETIEDNVYLYKVVLNVIKSQPPLENVEFFKRKVYDELNNKYSKVKSILGGKL